MQTQTPISPRQLQEILTRGAGSALQSGAEVNVSGFRYRNWHTTPRPQPLIINPEADLNTLIAWAHGEVSDLFNAARGLATQGCELNGDEVADLFTGRLEPVMNLLYHLGSITNRDMQNGVQ